MTKQEWQGVYRNAEQVWRNYNSMSTPRKVIHQMPAPDAAALFDGRLNGWDKEWLKRLKIQIP